jgi:hypothetical protein
VHVKDSPAVDPWQVGLGSDGRQWLISSGSVSSRTLARTSPDRVCNITGMKAVAHVRARGAP